MEARLFETAGIAAYPTRAAWDASAVEILATILQRWELVPAKLYLGGYAGTVLAVTTADGSPAVLKIGYPHPEAIAEAVALAAYPAGTAPTILRQDPWVWALLMERIEPGTPLSASGLPVEESVRIGAELLARVSSVGPVRGVPPLSDVVHEFAAVARARWEEQLPRLQLLDAVDLVAEAIAELDRLADDGIQTAMVHGDFNPGNILRAGEGWVVVDPKPMTGDPSYDLWPLISQIGAPFAQADPRSFLSRQLVIASEASGCDPVRSARWAFARTGLNVSWYLEERNLELAARDVSALRVWAGLLKQLA